eukprot:7170790-Prymnesium_polylepis.1
MPPTQNTLWRPSLPQPPHAPLRPPSTATPLDGHTPLRRVELLRDLTVPPRDQLLPLAPTCVEAAEQHHDERRRRRPDGYVHVPLPLALDDKLLRVRLRAALPPHGARLRVHARSGTRARVSLGGKGV